jgi:hypothetical protein
MTPLYSIPKEIHSRSTSFENPRGKKGGGGAASSPLGAGRKGSPARMLEPGSTTQLADIQGPGVIRHMWMTSYDVADTMRGLVVRIYWEGQQHPSVEAPLGDFFGFAHGKTGPFQTAFHSVGEKYALNSWLPMPFARNAKVTISNDLNIPVLFFYQIDYTIGDQHTTDFGRLHCMFRRENPTASTIDFEVLPKRQGCGRYLGTVIGVRPNNKNWWGEGELKMFIDGDQELPTIVGTGAEDYVGLSWGLQENAFLYNGANYVRGEDRINTGPVSMYRWHIVDPIYWYQDIRITIQQIGLQPPVNSFEEYQQGLYERQDDWSACTFWYEATPSQPVPPIPGLAQRLDGLDLCPNRSALPLQSGSPAGNQM